MRLLLLPLLATTLAWGAAPSSVHEFSMKTIDGQTTVLSAYKGKSVLIVNVASQCGYTPQYKGLEAIYRKYKDQGFVVVGVPANNFGAQEPGSNDEIKNFCKRNFDITFPMMAKTSVAGDDINPLYQYLTSQTGGAIQWNFTKILVDRNGKVVRRFEPNVDPESTELLAVIETSLK